MAEKILVPLNRNDRIDQITPYLDKVTHAGTSVVFLVHHPVSGFKWLQAYCGIMECGLDSTLMLRRMNESYSLKMRGQLAQRRVFHACEALHRLGVKVNVNVYTGSLRKTLRSYVNNGEVQLIVMRPGIGQRIVSFLRGTVPVSGMFKYPSASSVLLLQ